MRFLEALKNRKNEGGTVLIPDIKCYSPKEGDLMQGRDPVQVARQLEQAGACAISVVTEEKEFHGSMELLGEICSQVSVPVLRKDFITCEQDLDATKAAGADAILLMVSCLGEEKLTQLYHAALARNLMPLVETHTAEELSFALQLQAPLIGINNRDITVLERDDGTVMLTDALLQDTQVQGSFVIAESGLRDREDVCHAIRSGADAVLVGTAILQAKDPAEQYKYLTRKTGLKICGLKSRADVDACLCQAVDICGFVVQYPVDVRWNIEKEEAKELLDYVKTRAVCPVKTCVVTGGSKEQILFLARYLQPDYLQLHYRETLEDTCAIAKALQKEGIAVIRSIPKGAEDRRSMFAAEALPDILEKLAHSPVAAVLLDSRDAGNAACGGEDLLHVLAHAGETSHLGRTLRDAGKQLMAGGGITAANAGEVLDTIHPDYLDIMTGAEQPDGTKSADKIHELVKAIEYAENIAKM